MGSQETTQHINMVKLQINIPEKQDQAPILKSKRIPQVLPISMRNVRRAEETKKLEDVLTILSNVLLFIGFLMILFSIKSVWNLKMENWRLCKENAVLKKKKIVAEVDLMRKLDHPRLVKMIEAFQGEREIVVVMEHLAGGELFDLVADEEFQLTEGQCRGFMRQVCEGVAHLHSLGIVHLDLKPENIVCVGRETGEIKIVDFGTGVSLKIESRVEKFF